MSPKKEMIVVYNPLTNVFTVKTVKNITSYLPDQVLKKTEVEQIIASDHITVTIKRKIIKEKEEKPDLSAPIVNPIYLKEG